MKVFIPNKPHWKQCGGFSLVEVILAIGVIAFSMVGVLSLMTLSANSSRESSQDTAFALMTQTTLSKLRYRGFAAISSPALPAKGTLDDATPDFYYDSTGRMALKADGTEDTVAHADSIYGCTVTRYTPVYQASTNFIYLRFQYTWPVIAPAANQQKTIVYTGISNDL